MADATPIMSAWVTTGGVVATAVLSFITGLGLRNLNKKEIQVNAESVVAKNLETYTNRITSLENRCDKQEELIEALRQTNISRQTENERIKREYIEAVAAIEKKYKRLLKQEKAEFSKVKAQLSARITELEAKVTDLRARLAAAGVDETP